MTLLQVTGRYLLGVGCDNVLTIVDVVDDGCAGLIGGTLHKRGGVYVLKR